jgi:hypothetical protein
MLPVLRFAQSFQKRVRKLPSIFACRAPANIFAAIRHPMNLLLLNAPERELVLFAANRRQEVIAIVEAVAGRPF